MCLITRQQKSITAKKDIVVFKQIKVNPVMTNDENIIEYMSPYNHFYWKKGVTYKQKMMFTNKNKLVKRYIIHVYDFTCREYYFVGFTTLECLRYPESRIIQNGFHAAISPKRFAKFQYLKTYPFVIPKGAKYYLDDTGLIVSNIMKIHDDLIDVTDYDNDYVALLYGKNMLNIKIPSVIR